LVPVSAAERLRERGCVPAENVGRLRRLLDFSRLERLRVGERPAAGAGAEAGVVEEGLIVVSSRGVEMAGVLRRRFTEMEEFEVTFKE
jgi:hypothetical protein